MADKKLPSCFVICPIGAADSPERRWSDDVFKGLIEPVLTDAGYKPWRAIDESKVGEITTQIVQGIYEADLVVADITGHNPNVFYELAMAHSFNKPFIHIAEEGTRIPFDIGPINIIWIGNGFAAVDAAREQLKAQVEQIKGGDCPENPISRYLDRVRISETGTDKEKRLLELEERLSRLEHTDLDGLALRSKQRALDLESEFSKNEWDAYKERNRKLRNRFMHYRARLPVTDLDEMAESDS